MDKSAERRELDAAIMEAVRGERRVKRIVVQKKPPKPAASRTPLERNKKPA